MTTREQDQLAEVLAMALPDRSVARMIADGDGGADRATWDQLAELGVWALGLSPEQGGAGGGIVELCIASEAIGAATAPVPALACLLAGPLLHVLDGPGAADARRRITAGTEIVGVVVSADDGTPTGIEVERSPDGAARLNGTIADAVDASNLDYAIVAAGDEWWGVDTSVATLKVEETACYDRGRPRASLTFDGAGAEPLGRVDPALVDALARTLVAAEALGAGQAALDLAVSYAQDRRAFGQAIGSFQAIKHKLADATVGLELARSAVAGAQWSSDRGFPEPVPALMAKAMATKATIEAAKASVQVHGAVGCTWEHDLHLLLRRAKYTELLLGTPDSIVDGFADALVPADPGSSSGLPSATAGAMSLSPADEAFASELSAWLDGHATDEWRDRFRTRDVDERRVALRDWQALVADAGWAGLHWPTEHGGRDASLAQQVLYHAEIARRGLPRMIGNRGLSLVGPTIIVHGSDEQKARFLEPTRRADILWASGLSERDAGSDLASIRTRAVLDGDEFVVNGHKVWTTNAQFCDWLFTLVRTGPLVPKHAGISVLLIPLDADGVTVQPIRGASGAHHFNEVFLDDVRVSADNLVGELNAGWGVARTTLSHEHLTNFLGSQLESAKLVDRVVDRARRRGEDGREVGYSLKRRIAQSWVNTQVLRLHGLRNVEKTQRGIDPGPEGSIIKLFGQEEEQRIWELALDIGGASGLTGDRWGRAFLNTRASTIGGGSSEIHRNKIAERVLGLPRDPWLDDAES